MDLELLITSAAGVVMRRDMSLNRRLWVWFLGPDPTEQTSPKVDKVGYFRQFGLKGLTAGLLHMIEANKKEPAERARPFRICLSLMDRWEIGGLVVPELFVPIVSSIQSFQTQATSKEQYQDVVRSGAMFFDGVESHLIWGVIHDLVKSGSSGVDGSSDAPKQSLDTVSFILRTFNAREEEMIVIHAPLVVLGLVVRLSKSQEQIQGSLLTRAYGLAAEILEMIPQRAFHASKDGDAATEISRDEILPALDKFYSNQSTRSSSHAPYSSSKVGQLLLRELSSITETYIASTDINTRVVCQLLVQTLRKVPKSVLWSEKPIIHAITQLYSTDAPEDSELVDSTTGPLDSPVTSSVSVPVDTSIESPSNVRAVDFSALQGCVQAIAALYASGYLNKRDAHNVVFIVVKHLWGFLSPDHPKYHVEAVRALWLLQDSLKDRTVEAALSLLMTDGDIVGTYAVRSAEAGRRFAVLWTHSIGNPAYEVLLTRPLLLFLDALSEESTELHIFARSWLQNLQAVPKYGFIHIFQAPDLH